MDLSSTILIILMVAACVIIPFLFFKFGGKAYFNSSVSTRKYLAIIAGVSSVILWFMPFNHIVVMGQPAYQTGQHIGSIAYILLLSSAAYTVFSSLGNHQLRIISSIVGLCITIFYAMVISSIAWGLIANIIMLSFCLFLVYEDKYVFKDNISQSSKKCPHCAEQIKFEASICRYCQREV